MAALVIAEHDHGTLKPATLNTVTAALACGGDVHVLIAGANAGGAAQAAAQIAGVAKVHRTPTAPSLAEQLAENVAAQVLAIAKNYSHLLFPATAHGKNVAPRVAALLDVAQISDASKVVSADTFERPIYAGNAVATVQSGDPIKVITVRTTGFDAAAASGGSAAVETRARGGRQRPVELRRRRDRQARSPGTHRRQDHRQRWPRDGLERQVQRGADAAGRQARRRARCQPRGGRRGLRAQRLAGRARPARSWRRSCTSPAASRARSSTWPA